MASPQYTAKHSSLLEQRARRRHHCLVPTLNHPILLWRVGGGEVALDTFIYAVGGELHGGELPAVVSA